MECLCPKCGFIWDNDGLPVTDEMKDAVRLHLEGKFDSVVGALVAGPRFQAKLLAAQAKCDQADLARFKREELYGGPIEEGMIFVWGPLNPFAAELVTICGKRVGEDGAEIATRSAGDPRIFWNLEQLLRENLVTTPLKIFPGNA
jgi:hypothetical protein